MADFTIKSESVDVEEIMRRIRARIREKRGVDYTEEEVRSLASVKLERFLDPRSVRSDLVEHYRRERPLPPLDLPPAENYGFEDDTIYASSRGLVGMTIRGFRRVLNPILKLFFNPNPIIQVLHLQGRINEHNTRLFGDVAHRFALRDELDALNYEVLNNLVVEITRLGIEVKNLKMRLESLSSRLDFDERRGRALESVVQYRTEPAAREPQDRRSAPASATDTSSEAARQRRRRRRGGRRRGVPGSTAGAPGDETSAAQANAAEPFVRAVEPPDSMSPNERPPES